MDNFIQQINPYPADEIGAFLILIGQRANFIHLIRIYPLDKVSTRSTLRTACSISDRSTFNVLLITPVVCYRPFFTMSAGVLIVKLKNCKFKTRAPILMRTILDDDKHHHLQTLINSKFQRESTVAHKYKTQNKHTKHNTNT